MIQLMYKDQSGCSMSRVRIEVERAKLLNFMKDFARDHDDLDQVNYVKK